MITANQERVDDQRYIKREDVNQIDHPSQMKDPYRRHYVGYITTASSTSEMIYDFIIMEKINGFKNNERSS